MLRILLVSTGLAVAVACAPARNAPDGPWLQYATPEEVGWSSEALANARTFARDIGAGAVFVAYRGNAVVAWGPVDLPFKNYSVRKSYLSALFGIHVHEGDIDLEATLAELEIDDVHPLSETERSASVTDLLLSRSGVYLPAAYEPPGTGARRPERGSERPGNRWWYNNWDFNTLGGILQRATGRDLFTEFQARIAQLIGMEDFALGNTFFWLEPGKSQFPAYLFRMSARDMARFGHLFLAGGRWNGQEIVPAAWVEQSTALQVPFDGGTRGYGYLWWVDRADSTAANAVQRYNRYSARGSGGQHILVVPDLEVVMVHVADFDRGRGVGWNPLQELLSMILDAKTADPKPEPELRALAPEPLGDVPAATEPEPPPPPPPPLPPLPPLPIPATLLAALVGDYLIEPADSLTLFAFDERLFVRDDGFEIELLARPGGHLFSPWVSVVLEPVTNDEGTVEHLIVSPGANRSVARPVGR